MAVEVGLVDGTTAATTPNGSAISMTWRVFVARDDADGLHRPDELVDALGGEQVLLDLVGDDAVAGFLDGEPRERLGLRRGGRGHRVDDGVDLLLGELGELEPCLLRAPRERARFGDRGEIAIDCEGPSRSTNATASVSRPAYGLRQDPLDFGVRPRNDVHRHELADAARGGGAGVGRGLDRADVAADHHGDVAGADVLLADQTTLAALTIASAASTDPIRPFVSTSPSASDIVSLRARKL